jgi:hypothetical protein
MIGPMAGTLFVRFLLLRGTSGFAISFEVSSRLVASYNKQGVLKAYSIPDFLGVNIL